MKQTRRQFLVISAAATTAARLAPTLAARAGGGRRVLTLVYDKSLGMMRAIDRLVP
ncbi:Tat pathway signal protein [Gymnodinialimonas sp. 57CJ19]|uniref:Tat pathway signal protein n=1 Tax=Gymnodinialimonas sp. 57CJ19 TaxID=3138498 RepID=UPI00313429ED